MRGWHKTGGERLFVARRTLTSLSLRPPRSPTQIALLFSDESVLERFHLSQAFLLMHSDASYSFLDNMSNPDYRFIRRRIIELVLSTDLAVG